MSLTCKVLRVIAGSFLVFLVASSAWAGSPWTLPGEPVRGMKDGRVVLLLEIRSDAPLREVRDRGSRRLPLTPVGARFDEKCAGTRLRSRRSFFASCPRQERWARSGAQRRDCISSAGRWTRGGRLPAGRAGEEGRRLSWSLSARTGRRNVLMSPFRTRQGSV